MTRTVSYLGSIKATKILNAGFVYESRILDKISKDEKVVGHLKHPQKSRFHMLHIAS